jgi:hypothetical protein
MWAEDTKETIGQKMGKMHSTKCVWCKKPHPAKLFDNSPCPHCGGEQNSSEAYAKRKAQEKLKEDADGGIAPRYAKLHDTLTRHGWAKQEPSESENGMRRQFGGGQDTYTHPKHGKITVDHRLGNEVQHIGKNDTMSGKPTAWMHLADAHDYVSAL